MEIVIREGVKVQIHTDMLAFRVNASKVKASLSECIALRDYLHEFFEASNEASNTEAALPVSSPF